MSYQEMFTQLDREERFFNRARMLVGFLFWLIPLGVWYLGWLTGIQTFAWMVFSGAVSSLGNTIYGASIAHRRTLIQIATIRGVA